ncbi:hypothetical protein AWL63_24285 (plasmid) [Sphingomonas panacis]|uniref:Uncharacterized protein n=2 Tax=Sphingomonas panacis TaxID=1560345 RepID=A0A1B3ZIM0_9SPHN|nr:hypothetical protein AWL63_24285 [Sphingomonas panacis]
MKGAKITALALAVVAAAFAPATSVAAQTSVTREACAAKLRETGARFEEMSALMTAEADYADAHGGEFTPEMTRDFIAWYAKKRGRPGSDLPALHETTLTPAQRASKQAAADRFARQRMQDRQATMATLERDAKQFCARVKDGPN